MTESEAEYETQYFNEFEGETMSSDDRIVITYNSGVLSFVNVYLQGEDTIEDALVRKGGFRQCFENPADAYMNAIEQETEYGPFLATSAIEKIREVWDEQLITVYTGICPFCNERGEVKVPRRALIKYNNGQGEFVQKAWPDGSPGDREQLKSGIHEKCFDEATKEH